MEKEMGRGLKGEKLEAFGRTCWYQFYKENEEKDELFLGIRNNYVNIYYKGMNIAKIGGGFTKAQISNKYLGIEKEGYKSITCEELKKYYADIKKYIIAHVNDQKKREKEVQQQLMINNNNNKKSNWICIDMEYDKQRKNKEDGEKSGRFDIIAVHKEKPYRVALIELKVGASAISGKSGILKHAKDWKKVIKEKMYDKTLKKEIVDIINNKYCLDKGNYETKPCTEADLETKPEFYFLICSGEENDIEKIKNEVRKYLWDMDKCKKYGIDKVSDKYNIERQMKYDISEYADDEKLYCKFRFAEGKGENIKDIIDDKSYDTEIK